MKNKLIIIGLLFVLILFSANVIFAATGTVGIKANVSEVKKGDTFDIILSVQSEEGINGIDTKYTYDTDKLELVSASVIDSVNWSSLGTDKDITVICNSTSDIKSADIYKITFKVKDNVTVGDEISIKTTDILLDTNASTDSEATISSKEIKLKVIEDSKKEEDKEEENKQDESKKEEQNDKGLVENANVSTKVLPKTGLRIEFIFGIIILVIIGIIIFFKLRYYKEI